VKKSIGVLAALLVFVFWMSGQDLSDGDATNSQITVLKSATDLQQINGNRENPNFLDLSTATSKLEINTQAHPNNGLVTSTCTTTQQLDSDPRQKAVYQWLEESFGVDLDTIANIYAYSSETELLQAAQKGDSTAMLALGINYKWYAFHDNFQSDRLRPKDLPEVSYTVKPLDKNIMDKARYWLMQAALNNQLIGLNELAFSYADEKNHTEDMKEKQALEINFLAYFALVDALQPSTEKTIPTNLFYVDEKAKQKSLENKMAELVTQWREDRLKMGQNESLELNPSKEIINYLELQKNLCRDTNKEQ
tara:strand:+ start:161970 stop:162890 length:921 start_codon:yes stop_codon:yes gene_type:complete